MERLDAGLGGLMFGKWGGGGALNDDIYFRQRTYGVITGVGKGGLTIGIFR